ncbi:MAG: GrpB family protein [Holosporales bacterium]|jgi:GrpB-like predicted nucleotidyltransferase (UPF0157 family)|nr:GrpB family protein [Holosporales bacterium]
MNMQKEQKRRVEVVPYDSRWPAMFEAEKDVLASILGDGCIAIHHVGSTSVPGLAAKPYIDIVAVAKARNNAVEILQNAGYTYRGEWNIPLKCGFTKRNGRNVNLHMFFDEQHPEIELNLLFRDYLRTHTKTCEEYASLKMEILQDESSQERVGKLSFPVYTLRKREFIDDVLRKAGFNRLRVLKCLTETEWAKAIEFREKCFVKSGEAGLPQLEKDDPAQEHFVLYHGVDIIGYAHISLNPGKDTAAEIRILETSEEEANTWFLKVLTEWIKIHGYDGAHEFTKVHVSL